MLISIENRTKLTELLRKLKLQNPSRETSRDKQAKIDQIIAYLESIHSLIKDYASKRKITLVDCGAGNCYLSFLVYFFYKEIEPKNIQIHCIDRNHKLMKKCKLIASELGFEKMVFHANDIDQIKLDEKVDLSYSLHACDTATDQALSFGLQHNANHVLSVSCCQFSLKKQFKMKGLSGIGKHKLFREKMLYMVSDSMRGLLMESQGYKVDIFEFVSSRATGKNIMLRARKNHHHKMTESLESFQNLRFLFNISPALESYIVNSQVQKKVG